MESTIIAVIPDACMHCTIKHTFNSHVFPRPVEGIYSCHKELILPWLKWSQQQGGGVGCDHCCGVLRGHIHHIVINTQWVI